ncbi:MAG TPA: DMT family transporter [Oculatellaceae cyanobacterium]|jgi:drug/metabolite transporter (DMT)-like permease
MNLKSESKLPWKAVLLIAPFFFWGTAMVAMKGVIPNTTPLFMAGVRLLPAGVLVLAGATLAGRRQPQGWAAWLWIMLFALVDGTLFQGFLAEGLVRTSAGLGSVMIDSQPLAVAILSAWLFGEVIGIWGWLGLGFGVLGISLIGLPDEWVLNLLGIGTTSVNGSWQQLFEHGEWLMLLAALSMAVGTVLIRFVCRYTDAVVATGWHMILGGLPLFALSGVWETDQWTHIDLAGFLALSYSTIFGSAIAYGLFFYFASLGNLTSLSSLTFLTPIFALLFGNLFLNEVLSGVQSFGVGLTLVSIYLINQRDAIANKLKSFTTPKPQNITTAAIDLNTSEEENILLLEASSSSLATIPLQVKESEAENSNP